MNQAWITCGYLLRRKEYISFPAGGVNKEVSCAVSLCRFAVPSCPQCPSTRGQMPSGLSTPSEKPRPFHRARGFLSTDLKWHGRRPLHLHGVIPMNKLPPLIGLSVLLHNSQNFQAEYTGLDKDLFLFNIWFIVIFVNCFNCSFKSMIT